MHRRALRKAKADTAFQRPSPASLNSSHFRIPCARCHVCKPVDAFELDKRGHVKRVCTHCIARQKRRRRTAR